MARSREEDNLQLAVADYLNRVLLPPTFWFHPPMGGFRLKREAARLKAFGAVAGLPDVMIIHTAGMLGIELKSRKGRLSDSQKECWWRLAQLHIPCVLCRNIDCIRDTLALYKISTREIYQGR